MILDLSLWQALKYVPAGDDTPACAPEKALAAEEQSPYVSTLQASGWRLKLQ